MSKLPKPSLKDIASGAGFGAPEPSGPTPPAEPSQVVTLDPTRAPAVGKPGGQGTLKTRTRQLTVYLEPPVYDQLRDLAHTERAKMHGLILEALDFYFVKKKGLKSLADLTGSPPAARRA